MEKEKKQLSLNTKIIIACFVMVIIMKPQFTQQQLETAIREMEAAGVKVMISKGSETTVLGAEGNAAKVDLEMLEQLPGVSAPCFHNSSSEIFILPTSNEKPHKVIVSKSLSGKSHHFAKT